MALNIHIACYIHVCMLSRSRRGSGLGADFARPSLDFGVTHVCMNRHEVSVNVAFSNCASKLDPGLFTEFFHIYTVNCG